jgi:hypothetical protein
MVNAFFLLNAVTESMNRKKYFLLLILKCFLNDSKLMFVVCLVVLLYSSSKPT